MSKITGNESAFATPPTFNDMGQTCESGNDGLTIRQHFAAMCLQGLLSNIKDLEYSETTTKYRANVAVQNADALIEELKKEKA